MAKEIVSSTGELGMASRSDNRQYINAKKYVANPNVFNKATERVGRLIGRRSWERTVFRGVVSSEVMRGISSGHGDKLEVALPLQEFTGDTSWLVSMAQNAPQRRSIVSIDKMKRDTAEQRDNITSPLERVSNLSDAGYTFTDTITDADIDQVYGLWAGTFGWDRNAKEVEALQSRLAAGEHIQASNKDVWFSAVKDKDGIIAGLAMAERLTRPGADGKMVDIVESTEWRVNPEYRGREVMQAAISMLNAQVLADLSQSSNSGPLIYAECNFATRADRAGASAGFKIPNRDYAPQILEQNVSVGDSLTLGTPLRDFTFMYLTKYIIDKYYEENQRNEMLGYLRKK